MVKITDYKTFHREDGEAFYALVVQGGLEAVKSKETGRMYFTTKSARVPCTFNEEMCIAVIGTTISGTIKKVETEPYDYTNQQTGEVVERTHRYEYVSEEDDIIESNIIQPELVH